MAEYAKHAEVFFNAGDRPFFLSVNYPDAHRPFIKQARGLPTAPLTGHDVKPLDYFGLDLQADPHEFRNLAKDADYAATLEELKMTLTNWRNRTNDPLLDTENLKQLKSEIDNCIVDGNANKGRLSLTYPDYFFPNGP